MRWWSAFALCILICSCKRSEAERAAPDSSMPTATIPAASSEATVTDLPPCDAYKAWRADNPKGATWGDETARKEQYARFTVKLATWAPECRKTAMSGLCGMKGCDDMEFALADVLINAAADEVEKRGALQSRADYNVAAAARGRALEAKVKNLAGYALSILSSPRAKAYRKARTVEGMSAEMAAGNPCWDRMKVDYARIDALDHEIDGALPTLPFESKEMGSALMGVKSCVDCSDDRSSCGEISANLKPIDDTFRKYEESAARDRKLLKIASAPIATARTSDPDAPPTAKASPATGSGIARAKTPSIRQGATQVNGRLPPEAVQRIVRGNFGLFRACYEEGLRTNSKLAGRASVKFVIDRAGNVSTASDGGSDIPDQSVVSCVVRGFRDLKFPEPEGGIVTVVYPLILSPGD